MRKEIFLAGVCGCAIAVVVLLPFGDARADGLRDYAADPDFVESYRAGAIAMAQRKSAALGESPTNAPVRVGPRIATGGKFKGHYLWDSAFNVFWAVHAPKGALPIASTLDNFYRFAEKDGYIGREFHPDGTPTWDPEHPISFNPPMFAWAEIELADSPSAEPGRLAKVYPALVRHHRSCERKFRRPDGLYFSCGLGCGMDDMPRWPRGYTPDQRAAGGIPLTEQSLNPRARDMWKRWLHGDAKNQSWNRQAGWIDMSAAMALDARSLAEIATRLGKAEDARSFGAEYAALSNAINRLCWDEKTGFYYDVTDSGVIHRRHLGALWVLVSHVAPPERVERMIKTLFDSSVFYRTVPLASLEADDPDYTTEKGYFKGPAWPNLNFLAIRGLCEYGYRAEAERLARRWYNCCAALYEKTGGVYENLSSEQYDHPKERSFPDYAGHGCLTPVALPAMFGWGAGELKSVDFTAPGGVKCRLTAEDAAMWRVRTARADGTFAEVGAVQALARWMGETLRSAPRPLRETAESGGRAFTAPDGSKALLAADGSSLAFISATGRKVVEVTRLASGAKGGMVLAGRLLPCEAVYGLGERLDRLNKRGTRVRLCTSDGYNDSSASYVAIPLFSTTRGGGVFVNAYEIMTADFGASIPDEWRMEIEKDSIDAYVVATDRMRDVPPRYLALAGCPSVPDDWQFGPVVCRYAPDFAAFEGPTARIVHGHLTLGLGLKNIVEKYREMGALPTAVVAEGRGCNIFGTTPEEQERNRAEFRKAPDYLAKDGIRYMIYMGMGSVLSRLAPGFRPEYEVHVTVTDAAGGVKAERTNVIPFVTYRSNNPDVSKHHKGSRYLDITDPDAWRWYLDNVWQPLLDCGVRGAKIDFCEEMPDEGTLYGDTRFHYRWKHPEVFEGAAVHHAYPTFFIAKLCRDLTARLQMRGQGSFMALSRGGGIGAQRAPFMWAGDQKRDFAKLDDQLLAMLNAGVSGVPFMTYDMAGYHYTAPVQTPVAVRNLKTGAFDLSRTAPGPDEETVYRRYSGDLPLDAEQRLFLRGLAFTAYSPCIQTHGYVRHPFEFDAATRARYVSYSARHRALAGEIAAASRAAARTGLPVVRPLAWDYQEDENTWDIEDEYIFCDRYLVAPILADSAVREIYLPQGTWKEVDTGVRHVVPAGGKRFSKEVPFGDIAVFTRE